MLFSLSLQGSEPCCYGGAFVGGNAPFVHFGNPRAGADDGERVEGHPCPYLTPDKMQRWFQEQTKAGPPPGAQACTGAPWVGAIWYSYHLPAIQPEPSTRGTPSTWIACLGMLYLGCLLCAGREQRRCCRCLHPRGRRRLPRTMAFNCQLRPSKDQGSSGLPSPMEFEPAPQELPKKEKEKPPPS